MNPQEARAAIVQELMRQQGHVMPGVPQGLEGTPGPDQAEQRLQEMQAHKAAVDRSLWAPQTGTLEGGADYQSLAREMGMDRNVMVPSAGEMAGQGVDLLGAGLEAAGGTVGVAMPPAAGAGALLGGLVTRGGAGRTARAADELAREIEHIAKAPQSVPKADARPALEMSDYVASFIKSNRKTIKDVDGKRLTKAEQRELMDDFLSKGAEGPAAPKVLRDEMLEELGGPWGQNPQRAHEHMEHMMQWVQAMRRMRAANKPRGPKQ